MLVVTCVILITVSKLNPRKGTETLPEYRHTNDICSCRIVSKLNPRKGTETYWNSETDFQKLRRVSTIYPRKGTEMKAPSWIDRPVRGFCRCVDCHVKLGHLLAQNSVLIFMKNGFFTFWIDPLFRVKLTHLKRANENITGPNPRQYNRLYIHLADSLAFRYTKYK